MNIQQCFWSHFETGVKVGHRSFSGRSLVIMTGRMAGYESRLVVAPLKRRLDDTGEDHQVDNVCLFCGVYV